MPETYAEAIARYERGDLTGWIAPPGFYPPALYAEAEKAGADMTHARIQQKIPVGPGKHQMWLDESPPSPTRAMWNALR